MVQKNVLFIFLILTGYLSTAQPVNFNLEWDKSFGGDRDDAIGWFNSTNDGGYILGGTSLSDSSGDKTQGNHDTTFQSSDFWIIKTDDGANKMWDKRYGGNKAEILVTVFQTPDGGFFAGGTTFSGSNGDKSQPNWDTTELSNDYWIIKTDGSGNKLWDFRYGGNSYEIFGGAKQTSDGGFILCGSSYSDISGDKTEPSRGSWDYWMIKTNGTGNLIWEKRFGGPDEDFATAVDIASNGDFIIGGYSKSGTGGDKSEPNKGNWDYWIIRMDDQGNKIWDRTIGGNNIDWLFDLIVTSDGGILAGGQSFSEASGDKSEPNHDPTTSGSDRWIVKTDSFGNLLWDRTYGGDEPEDLSRIIETADGGFLISGESYSGANGNKSEDNLGNEQTWILKTDQLGTPVWDKTIFSYGHDEKGTALMIDSLCFVSINYTTADTGGYKSSFTQGNGDYWMTKMCMNDALTINESTNDYNSWKLFPNPATSKIYLRKNNFSAEKIRVEITDMTGKIVFREILETFNNEELIVDTKAFLNGMYICKINSQKNQSVLKFVVER